MLRKRTSHRSKKNRKRSNRSRVGSRIESLESRKMMFAHGAEECIDFEDLGAADTFNTGDTFLADNTGFQADFQATDFQWTDGTWFPGGVASTGHANWAGDVGQELVLNNINVDVDFGGPVEGLTMKAGEYGGNLNLAINGDFANFENFQDVNGVSLGGVTVNVVGGGFGNDSFEVQFDGIVERLTVGGQEFAVDHICLGADGQEGRFDWGDAPDQPYPTLQSSFGAYHVINPDVFLGTTVDGDPDGQPEANATGDDLDGVDDEDGVRMLTPMIPGQVAEVEVIASTEGFLNAWIDFGSNGNWTDPGDQVFSGEPLSPGANILSFNVPTDATPGRNFSRWRFSTTDKELGPQQSPRLEAPDGEVEDHLLRVVDEPGEDRFDWGDAPDQPYPTLAGSLGAHHLVNPDVFLGTTIDADPNGQPNVPSTGDDIDGTDDEDGVKLLTPLIPGQVAQVEVTASTDGFLNAWVDFQANGDWNDPNDAIFIGQPISAGANVLSFSVPANSNPGRNYSRWRFSTTHKELGPAHSRELGTPDGEVEDYRLEVEDQPVDRLDWGDAPDEPYPTLEASRGARHLINPDVFLGTRIDAEPDGQPSANALGDDNATLDDEDGVRFLTPLIPGQDAQVEVIASTDGFLNSWVDFDRNGIWSAAPEKIFEAQVLTAGVNVLTFHVPGDAVPGPNEPTFSRWRFSTTDRVLTPFHEGNLPDGEVEDHITFIDEPEPNELDFGDAPSRNQGYAYPTLLAENGARHIINPDVFMGNSIDAEPEGQPSLGARRDDFVTMDDEDGVRFLTPWAPGTVAKTDVLVSTDGFIDAWVDLNQDGQWDASEKVMNSVPVVAGLNNLDFNIPESAIPELDGEVYSRFRFSMNGGLSQGGLARDGEVEDYVRRLGDTTNDGQINTDDIDQLCNFMHNGDQSGDLNGDGVVDGADLDYLIHDIIGTHYGDANLDLIFNSADLIQVFAAGEYEDGVPMNSSWATGDWNCDGEFDSTDLVKAFADGAYVASAQSTALSPSLETAAALDVVESHEGESSGSAVDEGEAGEATRQHRLLELVSVDSLFDEPADELKSDAGVRESDVDDLFALL